MNSKYKIVVVISILLIILSMSITTLNYVVSLNNTQKHLKEQSLPLSLDNIYTVIQKNVIEPYLVSSMMANDTFLQSWIIHEEDEVDKIERYLGAIKNKYGMLTAFLVSEKSSNYYTHEGLLETIKEQNPQNKWYFDFKKISANHEINLDFNKNILDNKLIMFINYKILDSNYNLLGVTGVGLQISYINDMLKVFRQKHHFKVYFINEKGDIVLAEQNIVNHKNINEMKYLEKYKDNITLKEPISIEYKVDGQTYLLDTKYIPELNLYLLVEAKLDDFTKDVTKVFYLNLLLSLVISVIIVLIMIYLIKNYNRKLEYLVGNDQLTNINNRRYFEEKLTYQIQLSKRDKKTICVFFMDVDNFKEINDKYGHQIGDKVLIRIAKILKENIRKTDILARWGGEEFVCSYINCSKENSINITEKIREDIQSDYILKDLVNTQITASFGLTKLSEKDSLDSVIIRADNLMYKAKDAGKNIVKVD